MPEQCEVRFCATLPHRTPGGRADRPNSPVITGNGHGRCRPECFRHALRVGTATSPLKSSRRSVTSLRERMDQLRTRPWERASKPTASLSQFFLFSLAHAVKWRGGGS